MGTLRHWAGHGAKPASSLRFGIVRDKAIGFDIGPMRCDQHSCPLHQRWFLSGSPVWREPLHDLGYTCLEAIK